jgi:uncharacterized protein (TIGR02271 family)
MTQTTTRSTVVGVFREPDRARAAIEALKADGFAPDAISILSPDKQATQDMAAETGTHAGSGAATGAVAGGILGGLGGWLLGIGALAIPGVGPFIAAGAFASALGGAAIGAGVGAIAGALAGMGVPKDEAEYYEGEAKSGRTLVTVRADGRYDEAQRVLRQNGAYDIESRDAPMAPGTVTGVVGGRPVAATPADARLEGGQQTVQLREEELQPRKASVKTGQVTLGKEVVEEKRTLEVPVTREEVFVERHQVDRPADQPIEAGAEQTIDVPVREQRVQVDKQAVVYEEVGVNKQQVVQNQPVSATVRREELRVDTEGDVNVGGGAGATTSWDEVRPMYRQRWQQHYGMTGRRWEDYEPGYRYGYELRSRPEYRGRNWTEVESDVQRDWTRRNPTEPWERVRESVRDTWENPTS